MALIHSYFFSEQLGMCVSCDVILPQRRESLGEQGTGEKYKTLYLLHGFSDDETIWQRRTSIERYAANYPQAIVMPDGGRSFYTDMKDIDNFDGIPVAEGQELSFQGDAVVVKGGGKTTYFERTESEGFNELFSVTEKDGKKVFTNDDEPYDEKEAQAFIDKIAQEAVKPLAEILKKWK